MSSAPTSSTIFNISPASTAAPGSLSSSEALFVAMVVLIRALFCGLLLFTVDYFLATGTSPWLLSAAALIGIVLGTAGAFSRARLTSAICCSIGVLLIYRGAYAALIAITKSATTFTIALFGLQSDLALIALGVGAWSTWCFWRYRSTVTLEAIVLALSCILMLSGHREYHFDLPRLVSSLAWWCNVSHLTMLLLLGGGVLALTGMYLYFGRVRIRPINGQVARERYLKGRLHLQEGILFFTVLATVLALVAGELYHYYYGTSQARTANGVGQEKEAGLSPLTFQSALGSTNQPAGVLRLESDYKGNPHTPMLYLRESALSQYDGKTLVIGSPSLDNDAQRTGPSELYERGEDPTLSQRVPVTQSLYLLADHQVAFALDYPLSITPLKNPNPGRFKGAFRALSLAPTSPLATLRNAHIGDPRWSEDIKSYYLKGPSDPRYAALAQQITKGVSPGLPQALRLVEYLNQNAIYTLTPHHEVAPQDDPVIPFLFGDKRGYCVHFAHALVYMFRSLGIPSRIATGYLTDLSQAKDGHVLLRMSDRHAWAEIYFQEQGWIPFDVQPEQVESHANSDVDMKLLEELMGLLGPSEEALPDSLTSEEKGVKEPWTFAPPRWLWAVLVGMLVFPYVIKVCLRYAYIIPGGAPWYLYARYLALSSFLVDAGYRRNFGEDLSAYSARLSREHQIDITLTSQITIHSFAEPDTVPLVRAEIAESFARDRRALRALPLSRHIRACISLASVAAFAMGRRW